MSLRKSKTSRSQYPPDPTIEDSISDLSVNNQSILNVPSVNREVQGKSKQKITKSRESRISQLGDQTKKFQRVLKIQMEQKNNYFQNIILRTRCNGCGQMSETSLDYRPGFLAFTTCIILSPFGMGSCLLPFFYQKLLGYVIKMQSM